MSLTKMEQGIIGDWLKILTDSINSIGSSKEVEDWMNIIVEKKNREIEYLRVKVDSL